MLPVNDQLLIGILIGMGVFSLVLLGIVLHLRRRLGFFMRGQDGSSLEELLQDALHTIHRLEQAHLAALKHQKSMEKRLRQCIRTPTTLRFNPFRDTGSNQSFATSFLDESGDGLVISSLYTQGKTSIFAKPVREFISEYDLTHEESHVLQHSKNQVL